MVRSMIIMPYSIIMMLCSIMIMLYRIIRITIIELRVSLGNDFAGSKYLYFESNEIRIASISIVCICGCMTKKQECVLNLIIFICV